MVYLRRNNVDLHLHSIYSDGKLTPKELIDIAKQNKLRAVSITDHDIIDGVAEGIRHGNTIGVEVIPGVELSTNERGLDLHILGYFFDIESEILKKHLAHFREVRTKRAQEIVERLHKLGFEIMFADIQKGAVNASIGRPHIASAMVEYGIVGSVNEAFKRYLGDHKAAFVPKYKISAIEAIEVIRSAGGLSFLAHPGTTTPKEIIITLIKAGLNGIETIHPKHKERDIHHYRKIVREYDILECGGSDFHEPNNHNGIGKYVLPYSVVQKMISRLNLG